MTQVIIGFAGRKQSGKNTGFNKIKEWCPDTCEFSFAYPLKRMCVDIMGLTEEQAFGNDAQKNTLVPHLLWENFPVKCSYYVDTNEIIVGPPNRNPMFDYLPKDISENLILNWANKYSKLPADWHNGQIVIPKVGPMTAREVLQYYGTEIFRKHYNKVWTDACIRSIRKSKCQIAVITDCRFPNEVQVIQENQGHVIKLTRQVYTNDNHPSETALDAERYDQRLFDYIIDNAKMDLNQYGNELLKVVKEIGIIL